MHSSFTILGLSIRFKHNMRKKNVKYFCMKCSKQFPDISAWRFHVDVVHKKKFLCEFCDKPFRRKTLLKGHILKTHQQKSELFKCDICKNDFDTQPKLSNHIRLNRLCVHQIKVSGKGKITDFDETWVG